MTIEHLRLMTCAVLLVWQSALVPASAHGDEGKRVLLVQSETHAELTKALVKELRASGFDAINMNETLDPLSLSDFVDLARRLEIVGALRIMPDDRVEIWATDESARVSVKRIHRLMDADAASEAVSTVELLRACLLQAAFEPPSAPESEQPQIILEHKSEPESPVNPRLSMDISAATTMGTLAKRPMIQLDLRAHYRLKGIVGAELIGFVPMIGLQIKRPYGNVKFNAGAVTAGLHFTFGSLQHTVRSYMSTGAGLGIAKISTNGVEEYFITEQRVILGFMPYGTTGLKIRINDLVGVNVGIFFGFMLPRIDIYVMRKKSLSWGMPVLSVNIGLGAGFF
ncbi:MAG: hypothetical protein GY847_24725 [Proteobacteria bacterium]|nr:hypothetical protein [Pseudomonadota bacterium]